MKTQVLHPFSQNHEFNSLPIPQEEYYTRVVSSCISPSIYGMRWISGGQLGLVVPWFLFTSTHMSLGVLVPANHLMNEWNFKYIHLSIKYTEDWLEYR